MNISYFFANVLGANRRARWSWGAVDPATNGVFLQIWDDNIESHRDGERVKVDDVSWRGEKRVSNGASERGKHLALIQSGFDGFGVVCTSTEEGGVIKHFDDSILLRLGVLKMARGRTFARIVERVPVSEIQQRRSTQGEIPADLEAIRKLPNVDSTTKDALICARVGQGKFRRDVLAMWNNCCSVTGSSIEKAIRASHIQSWRESTNNERLDSNNGLPLIASLDALFDAGLISFESSGKLLIASKISVTERRIFGLEGQSLRQKITPKTGEYLTHHRDKHGFHI